jgi:hypothetical protein
MGFSKDLIGLDGNMNGPLDWLSWGNLPGAIVSIMKQRGILQIFPSSNSGKCSMVQNWVIANMNQG